MEHIIIARNVVILNKMEAIEIKETSVLDFEGIGLKRIGSKIILDKVIVSNLPWDNFIESPRFYKDYESIIEIKRLRRQFMFSNSK